MAALVVASALLLVASCDLPQGDRELRGNAARAAAVDSAVTDAVEDANDFAADLWRDLLPEHGDENLVISPPAIALGLGMVGIGASGATGADLAGLLHIEDTADLPAEHNALSQYISGQAGEQRNGYRKGTVRAQATPALWAQVGVQLDQPYLDTLAGSYGLGVRLVDFRSDPESARVTLQARAAEDLPGAPAGLVDIAGIDETTKLVSLSSGTITAPWESAFTASATAAAPFTLDGGTAIEVPTMVLNAETGVRSGRGDGWEAVELPYLGGTAGLLVIIPDHDTVDSLVAGLDHAQLDQIGDELQSEHVEVRLPRFSVSSLLSIAPILAARTQGNAFDPTRADLSHMTSEEGLSLGPVAHSARLRVDEEGSDATVAAVESPPSLVPPPRRVDVDRPFFFAVRDRASGLLLLTGWVVDPSLVP